MQSDYFADINIFIIYNCFQFFNFSSFQNINCFIFHGKLNWLKVFLLYQ